MMCRLVVMGLLASAIVFAQRGGGGRGGGGGNMNMPNIGFGATSKLDRITEMLGLSKDQKKDLKQTFDDAQKEAAPVHDQLTKARSAVADAVAAGKSGEELAKVVNAEGALEAQMASIELKAFAKVAQGLDEDQQKKAPGLYMMMRGMFSAKNWNSE
jgi:uncharacterized membrane protein